jgi:hypothetical protein
VNLRRYLTPPLVGYLILAGGVGYAVDEAYEHSDDGQKAVTVAVNRVLKSNCEGGNSLRVSLQQILQGSLSQVDKAEAAHKISASDAATERIILGADIAKVAPRDCNNVKLNVH